MRKKLSERTENIKIIDLTGGRKPEKREEISILRIEDSKIAYKVIGTKLKKQKPSKWKDPGYLGWDMVLGRGQGAGYYFVNNG